VPLEVEAEFDWKIKWEAVVDAFYLTAQAFASKLLIRGLDIFTDLTRCSLACGEIVTVLNDINLSSCFEKVQKLSISLSHHQIEKLAG
jgi:hypothetical protein